MVRRNFLRFGKRNGWNPAQILPHPDLENPESLIKQLGETHITEVYKHQACIFNNKQSIMHNG